MHLLWGLRNLEKIRDHGLEPEEVESALMLKTGLRFLVRFLTDLSVKVLTTPAGSSV